MLDFWATWCGPCIAELPHLKKAYADWHDKGFDVLGISFDDQDLAEKLTTFTTEHEMPWPQIYEGKGWNTSLGELYDVSGIPFVLLVDGDSGEIVATARNLHGPDLSDFIGKALEQKNADVE
jgi:thiol-disulfide isomerase/thioredoxin